MTKKFKVGDRVKAFYVSGNAGEMHTRADPIVGTIESIGTHYNRSKEFQYKVVGWGGCWSADELELLNPFEERLLAKLKQAAGL